MTFKDHKHFTPIQIRFGDIDKVGHVNNACYLAYFELARLDYFNQLFKDRIDWAKEGFVVARSELNHLQPVYLYNTIYCYTKVSHIGHKSMAMQYAVVKKENGLLIECTNGSSVLVTMDHSVKLSMPVPALWRELIGAFEGAGNIQ